MKHLIHQSDQELQTSATDKTTEAVNLAREDIVGAIKGIPNSSNGKLDDIINAIKSIPKTIIPEVPDFPEIEPTDMSETNELLTQILNKEEREMPEFPKFPAFPEIPKTDLTQTNNLLKQLIEKEDKDLDISVSLKIV